MSASDAPLLEAFHEGKSYDGCVEADPDGHWRLR